MANMQRYLHKDENYIYLDCPYAEAYIPKSFFGNPEAKNPIASEYGSGFQIIGIFNIKFFPTENTPPEKVPTYLFNFPNIIETYPSSSVTVKMEIDGVEDTYRVLQYKAGDIISSAVSTQSVTNCERFMNMMISGKIPRALSYTDIAKVWQTNFDINGISPGVPFVLIQALVANMCRNPSRMQQPYRMIAGSDPHADMHGYRAASMNEITAFSSVMAALSFERVSEKITTSLNMSYNNIPQKKSPIEQVLTM